MTRHQNQKHDSTRFIVAIDGGGSKVSAAAISKQDAILHWPTTAADCPYETTIEGTGSAAETTWPLARQNIQEAVDSLCDTIPCRASDLDLVLLALSGAGRPADRNRVLQWAQNHAILSKVSAFQVVGDIDPIVDFQATPDSWRPSIAVIVGTGSIVASRAPRNPLIRAGGWGPILGDEASGWAIARDALRAVCIWLDNTPPDNIPDELIRLVIEHLGSGESHSFHTDGNREELNEAILSLANDRKRAAKLAPRILQLAYSHSDSLASQIVDRQIGLLVAQIRSVYAQSGFSAKSWNLVLSGGLICNSPQFQAQIVHACEQEDIYPRETIQVDPLVAALQMATRMIRNKQS